MDIFVNPMAPIVRSPYGEAVVDHARHVNLNLHFCKPLANILYQIVAKAKSVLLRSRR
jgi:hypothetical protein